MSYTRVPYTEEQKRKDEEHLRCEIHGEQLRDSRQRASGSVADDDLEGPGLGGQVSLMEHMTGPAPAYFIPTNSGKASLWLIGRSLLRHRLSGNQPRNRF